MIRIKDRARIPATPERLWEWFSELEEHYLEWHSEHLMWRNLRGSPTIAGSVIFFDEWIGSFRLAARCRVAEVRPGRYFRYEAMFPYSLIGAGGSFALEPANGECDLLAEVYVGNEFPVLGAVLDRLIPFAIPLDEARRHIAEEGRNLARLMSEETDDQDIRER